MNTIFFNTKECLLDDQQKNVLKPLREHIVKREIQTGMSMVEIAEIISSNFVDNVKTQFEEIKKQIQEEQQRD